MGYRIAIAVDYDDTTADGYVAKKMADKIVRTDTQNPDVLLVDVLRFCNDHEVCAVLSFTEPCIEATAYVVDYLGLKGPSLQSIRCCRNKFLLREATKNLNLQSPKYFAACTVDEIKSQLVERQLNFPVILKPMDMAGACGVARIDSIEELDYAFSNIVERRKRSYLHDKYYSALHDYWLIEEYIEGFEVSAETYTFNGITTIVAIHDKVLPVEAPYFIEGIAATPSPRIAPSIAKNIEDATKKILKAINFSNGVTHTEFRITNEGAPVLLEVNGRVGGGLMFESALISTGVNLCEALIKICLGMAPPKMHGRIKCVVSHEICPPEGIIQEILGVQEIQKCEEIEICRQYVHPGDVIKTSAMQWGVLILASGNDYQHLINLIKDMTKKVKFIMCNN